MTNNLELFLQMCPAAVSWCRDAAEVAVKLAGCHFRLFPQNGFHQGIVDEDVLLLDQPNGDKRQKGCWAAGMADGVWHAQSIDLLLLFCNKIKY